MTAKTRRPLGLEALEDRWVPATIRFDGSNLFVSNPNVVAGASKITVVEAATSNAFTVTDGTANDGTYTVTGNITVLGNNAKDTIAVTLSATGLAGNVNVQTGNGSDTVTVDGKVAAAFVAGNTNVNLGQGTSSVTIGGTTGLANKGSITGSTRSTGANIFQVGGGTNSTFVGGLVSTSGFPGVALGGKVIFAGLPNSKDVFAGGVNINFTGNSQNSGITLFPTDTDLGNFTIQGGPGATNTVITGSVLGTLALNMGNGTNALQLQVVGPPITIGNLIFTGGNGRNFFDAVSAAGTVNVLGNVVLNWGNGANFVNNGGTLGTTALVVQGNMSVTSGNGGLDGTTVPFQGVVNGNLTVNTGNGNNAFTLDGVNGANVGGNFNYTGGNGGNSVTVTTTAADLFNLNVRFGNSPGTGAGGLGNNIFQIGTAANTGFAPGTLTGNVSWGIPTSAANGNAFTDDGYVWNNNVTLTNIPS